MEHLKPCPFCGGEEIQLEEMEGPFGDFLRVFCVDCEAEVTHETYEEVVEAWNRRV